MKTPRQQIDLLLQETTAAAELRQQTAFDAIASGRRKIVIFGAGRLGRSVCQGLMGTDLEPVAFVDNNPQVWGTEVQQLPVLSAQDAARKYSEDAAFIVSIWHPSNSVLMPALLAQIRALGCCAIPFPLFFWRQASTFLPYFLWDLPTNLLQHRIEIVNAFEMLSDECSRQTFANQLQLRLLADFECIGSPFPGEQYFPGAFSVTDDECFVDCGSYTGDTIRSFLSQTENRFRKIVAFEADSLVLPSLETYAKDLGTRVALHNAAVGAHTGVVHFSGNGIGGGHISDAGIEVSCVRLDDALADEHVSLIKMDIEGAELDALEGARQTIERDRPILAICAYHKPDHLWRIVAALKSLAPESALFLRSHCADGLDTVCYAVPPERHIQLAPANEGNSFDLTRTRGSFS
jgi:FkbM family methyltransferase